MQEIPWQNILQNPSLSGFKKLTVKVLPICTTSQRLARWQIFGNLKLFTIKTSLKVFKSLEIKISQLNI